MLQLLIYQEVNKLSLTKLDIESARMFLKMAAKEIKNKNYYIIPHKYVNGRKIKSVELIYKIGISNVNDIWNYILELTSEDCVDVSMDYDSKRDMNTEIYEFKKIINGKKVYIKLTIRNKLICMSFHTDYYR
jgi:hypothetical protein